MPTCIGAVKIRLLRAATMLLLLRETNVLKKTRQVQRGLSGEHTETDTIKSRGSRGCHRRQNLCAQIQKWIELEEGRSLYGRKEKCNAYAPMVPRLLFVGHRIPRGRRYAFERFQLCHPSN